MKNWTSRKALVIIEQLLHSHYEMPVVPVIYKTTFEICVEVDGEDPGSGDWGQALILKNGLNRAYQQIKMYPNSQPFLAINTHRVLLYAIKLMTCWAASAPPVILKIIKKRAQRS